MNKKIILCLFGLNKTRPYINERMERKTVYKILVLGRAYNESGRLIMRYVDNCYISDEIWPGPEFRNKEIFVDGEFIKFQIWQVTGSCPRIGRSYYLRNLHGVIIIFDVTKEDAFQYAKYFLDDIKKNAECDLDVILIGNESDSDRIINKEEAEKFANDNNMHYFDISIRDNRGVDEAFTYLATQIHHHHIYKNTKANFPLNKKKSKTKQ